MKMKKAFAMILALTLVLTLLSACNNSQPTAAGTAGTESVKIKIANIYGADTYESLSMQMFKKIVEEKNSNITVEVYPNAQLGNEETLTDSVRQGSVEIVVVGTVMTQYIPNISVAEYPYLFDGWSDCKAVLTNKKFIEMTTAGIENQGITFLGYNPVGFRVISANKELSSMDALNGLRLRTPNIPIYLTMAQSLGTNAIAMPLSELFTGLEQKVVDAQENPYNVIIANKFYEVQPYILESNHMMTTHAWYANSKFLDGLSEQNRAIIKESIAEAIEYCWEITQSGQSNEVAYLEGQGVTVIVPDDSFKQQMRDSQKPVMEWFLGQYPETADIFSYVEEIRNNAK